MHFHDMDRRAFLTGIGTTLGLATAASPFLSAKQGDLAATMRPFDTVSPEQVASTEDFWLPIQQSFSVGRSTINLNNAGVSPSPQMVTEALVRYQWQQEDTTAHTMWHVMQPQLETVRSGLADLFGCDREEIAITRNASESLEILLMGIDLKRGDEVLATTQDYPRMLTTLRQRMDREGISLKLVKIPVQTTSTEEIVRAFEKGITPKTKLMLVTHQINLTGQLLPVKELVELARSKGIEVIVDGAQSFAQFSFSQADLGCDYFGTSLHKWLCAPKGTGMLYVKRSNIGKIWPLMAAEKKQSADIRKFEEIGTNSIAIKMAIGEAITFHQLIGAERKEARLRYLSRYWMNNLKNIPKVYFNTSFGEDHSCAIANFGIEGINSAEIGGYLQSKHKIFTTPIIHDEFQGIRISPNLYTTLAELDTFANIVADIAKKGLPQ